MVCGEGELGVKRVISEQLAEEALESISRLPISIESRLRLAFACGLIVELENEPMLNLTAISILEAGMILDSLGAVPES